MKRWRPESMTPSRRLFHLFGAVLSMVIALVILFTTGLPQRAAFTGTLIPGQLPIAPEINAIAPDFERPTTDGQTVRLSDFRGSPVVVNFWATWCGPCIVEMPILQSIFEQRQKNDLHILAVNIGEPASVVSQWQDTYRLTYDLLIDEQQSVSALYRLRGQPSTYIISPEGVITDIFFGPVTEAALTAAIG